MVLSRQAPDFAPLHPGYRANGFDAATVMGMVSAA